jgi:hypothetical protein
LRSQNGKFFGHEISGPTLELTQSRRRPQICCRFIA